MSELTSMLARHEGIRLLVYDDATDQPITQGTLVHGHPTIGIGRALDVHGITPDEAEYLLSNDVDEVVASLRREFYWYILLNGPRQDAVADLVFNVGMTKFKGFVKTIAALDAANYEEAAKEMLDSKWAVQVGVRATELSEIVRTGNYQS